MNKEILISNIDIVHTTEIGVDRIKITINSYIYTIITAHLINIINNKVTI